MIDRKKSTSKERFELAQELMRVAVETEGAFRIFPPEEVVADESLWQGDDVVERLSGTIWRIEFRNGDVNRITFTDLVLLLFNFREINRQMQEAHETGTDEPVIIKMVTTTDPRRVMKPHVIRRLFNRMEKKRTGE